jgi:hypothetical protein
MTKTCNWCHRTFEVKPSQADKRSNCSRECMAAEYRARMSGAGNPNWKDGGSHYACLHCGATFVSYDKGRKYCSVACAAAATAPERARTRRKKASSVQPRPRRRRPHVTPPPKRRICDHCGRGFASNHYRRFCPECSYKTLACVICGAEFKHHRSQRKLTCSTECGRMYRSKRQQGEQSHRWRGGRASEATVLRASVAYTDWRCIVFERDHYTCQMCMVVGTRLCAHHIQPFAQNRAIALDPRNGITLCWPCHRSIRSREAEYEERFSTLVERNST